MPVTRLQHRTSCRLSDPGGRIGIRCGFEREDTGIISSQRLVLLVSGPTIVGIGGLVFRALGYRISIAGRAEEAVALLREDLPAVVLCEVDLPDLDGVELTRLIRTTVGGEQTIVILIGDGDEPAGNAADGYLRQPFDPMKAIELIEALGSA